MSDVAIHVEAISKRYAIGVARQRYPTLRDKVVGQLTGLFRRDRRGSGADGTIWALRDLSFSVRRGEVLGIVGRNGAGKSTLLKILSRITEPTTGEAHIRGRVGSLLEVGTGFHPELTGRENVYLSGSILGMRQTEIDRKFDEIVDFAEVDQFIDTPVKFYSSGMYVRLAFAVAAHLDPEILIVDEVLAVGDAAFQRKCLGRLGQVAGQGRTVLFVSHNLNAISNLCTTALWLEHGRKRAEGDVASIVKGYLDSTTATTEVDPAKWKRRGTGEARIQRVRLLDEDRRERDAFAMGDTLVFEIDVEFFRALGSVELSLTVKRADTETGVVNVLGQDAGFHLEQVRPGVRRVRVVMPGCLLYPTLYRVDLWVGRIGSPKFDSVSDAISFSMVPSSCSKRTSPFSPQLAVYHQPTEWEELPPPGPDDDDRVPEGNAIAGA